MIRAALLSFSAVLIALNAAAAAGPNLVGNWARADGGTRVAIQPCGQDYCAINSWVKDPGGDEAVGDKLVMTLKPKSDAELEGTAFDQKRDAHYALTISFDQSGMTTHGCVLAGIVCKDSSWTRIR